MPLSVRLDKETEARIRRLARAAGRSKSWVVREAVTAYEPSPEQRAPIDALAPFIGVGDSGQVDLSEQTGERFAAVVRNDARTRRAR
jgi:hypothetical protein